MRAATYMRISDDREGTGLGVQRQRDDCAALVERHGWTLAGDYTDNDTSAYHGKARPEYERLLADVEAGIVDAVVAWSSDRLTRHPRELETLVELVERTGVALDTVTSGTFDLTNPEGRAYARIAGAMARQESERKSVRARRKAEELAAAGKVGGGGTRPFGFEDDRVTVRPDEAELIREATERVISGEPLRAIMRDWQDRDIRPVGGGMWRTSSLRRLLGSPRIAGLREHRGEVVGEACWDGIITPAQHERLKAILTDPTRRTTPVLVRKYLLTGGLLVCGRCGAGMVARPKEDRRRQYVCAKGPDFGGCGRMASLAEPLEDEVRDQVFAVLAGDGLAAAIDAATRETEDADAADQLREARERLDDLAAMYADASIGKSEWLTARKPLTEKIETLESRLSRADRVGMLATVSADQDELAATWKARDVVWRRALLETVVDSVVLHPAVKGRNRFDPSRVEVVWSV